MDDLFKVVPLDIKKKLFSSIKEIVRERLYEEVIKVDRICNKKNGKIKTYKVSIKNGSSIRLDIKFPDTINRLQTIAFNHDIEIPEIILIQQPFKFSKWVEGVMLGKVWNIADVFIKSGDLIGRLNKVKDLESGGFLINSEFSSTNAIYTPNKRVYIIDHDRLKTSTNPDDSIVQIVLKRIRERERIMLFLNAYSKHRDINNIMEKIEKRKWNWDERKKLITNAPELRY
jgi:hypothetical protein